MNLQFFSQLWNEGKAAETPNKTFWDNRAAEFNKQVNQDKPDERIQKIVQFLIKNNLLTKNSNVLDIGCGPGKFAVEFAKESANVIGLDISDKMVEYAVQNSQAENLTNISFETLNWDKVDLNELGWQKYFDLVTAINSPGIYNQTTLQKMIDACRGYCFLSNFVERSDSVQDILRSEILKLKEKRFFHDVVYCVFNILWLSGYYPNIVYVDTDRDHVRTLEEACTYYSTLFETESYSDDQKNKLIKSYLEKISIDGTVTERVRTKTAWIYWKV
jgi:SAM-dependent methyltransferase